MLELLAPAGSMEAVAAAVQNGTDAVYLGYGDFNARRNAKNFSEEEFAAAVSYCHLRGAKVYLTLNTLLTDRELPKAAEVAAQASAIGADAVLIQDLGVLRMLRQVAPDLPVHASTQMTLHNLDGVKMAADLGLTRAVLSRELSRDQIEYICQRAPIEIEVFAHGALCMCYSGQCFLSSVIGGRSGNRGLCAQPCRLKYGWMDKADAYPLSLKDLSLAGHLRELRRMGVACVKLEGRMKRPEYVAVVTGIYARAIKEDREPTEEELEQLRAAFSRQGFTQGYYLDQQGPDMFGVREETREPKELFAAARNTYQSGEAQRVPVTFYAMLRPGEPAFTETTPYAPNSPYSASKASSDHFVRAYHETYGLPTLITNCSNNYGPRQFPEKLIPLVILNALSGKPLPIYGTGENIRDWLHVEDHCEAIVAVLEKGAPGECYNIGGHSERANIDVVRSICRTLDKLRPTAAPYEKQITFVADRPGHDLRYAIDAAKIEQEIGWGPRRRFEEGLRETVGWYLENAAWVENIQSGEYRQWLETNYSGR